MKRDFKDWFKTFRDSISDYNYYVDFEKVYRNGVQSPQAPKCIPLILAVRGQEIYAIDGDGEYIFNFKKINYTVDEYKMFMRKTGLFDLISNHIINNLVDYVTGVEVGLDSNGRKNRGGHLMENLVEDYLQNAGLVKGKDYFKEMYISDIQSHWDIDLSNISNTGKTEKRFDFVVKKNEVIYGIEANFYKSGGSKLNETARSYKNITVEAKEIPGFTFVWFTDGKGWKKAKHNLEETFDVLDNLYCITDLENGIITELFG